MPDKPETWALLIAWIQAHHPLVYAAFLSVCLAFARLIYGGGGIRKAFGEGVLCGLITLAASNGLQLFGIPLEAAPFFGGMVGLIGADGIRSGLNRVFKRKVETL